MIHNKIVAEEEGLASILIIDDCETIREMLETELSFAGFDVCCAADGDTGLEILNTKPIDIVVLDIVMPNKDGIEVIEEIRSKDIDIKIIAISGSKDYCLDTVRLMNIEGVLHKPFAIVELVGLIKQLLEGDMVENQLS